MGKKSRSFIDKRTAASFHVIHRPAPSSNDEEQPHALLSSASTSVPFPSLASSAPRYWLQPSRSTSLLPPGFPVELLIHSDDAQLLSLRREEERLRRRRVREAEDESLLPHDYDYSAHLRDIGGGGGVFVGGGGGAKERREGAEVMDPRAFEPVVADALDGEVDWALVRRAEDEGRRARKRRAGEGGGAGKVPLDVEAAMRALDEEGGEAEFDELEDDFVLRAIAGDGAGQGGDDGAEEEKGTEEEGKADDSEGDDLFDRTFRAFEAAERKQRTTAADDGEGEEAGEEEGDDHEWEDEEGEEEKAEEVGPPSAGGSLDAEFDRLVAAAYGEADIGGLDSDDGIAGPLSLAALTAALELSGERPQPSTEGGASLDLSPVERRLVQRRLRSRLRAMGAAEEGQAGEADEEAEEEDWLPAVYRRKEAGDDWDVQSILSTRSSAHHQPRAIREQSRRTAAGAGGAGGRSAAPEDAGAGQRERGSGAPAEAGDDGEGSTEAEDEEAEAADEGLQSRANKGEPRPRGESASEKRRRKAASRLERAERRLRKKQSRSLHSAVELAQRTQRVQRLTNNPTARAM